MTDSNKPPPLIQLTGYKDERAIDEAFASYLVDVAYVHRIEPGRILVEFEEDIDIEKVDDYSWLCSVIQSLLQKIGEDAVAISRVANTESKWKVERGGAT